MKNYIITFICPDTGKQITDTIPGSCVEDVQRAISSYWILPHLYPINIVQNHANQHLETVQLEEESTTEIGGPELHSVFRNWTSSS